MELSQWNILSVQLKNTIKYLLRTFFENCCPEVPEVPGVPELPEPPVPVLADRVELRWGPSAYDLDLYVLEYEEDELVFDDYSFCLTVGGLNCSDTSSGMDMYGDSPGPEIITWNANSKKYVIYAMEYDDITFIDSQVSYGSRRIFFFKWLCR